MATSDSYEMHVLTSRTELSCRPLFAATHSGSIAGDLERAHTVHPSHDSEGFPMLYGDGNRDPLKLGVRSPAMALLGVASSASATRALEAAYAIGVDWCGGTRPDDGAEITGAVIVERIRSAVTGSAGLGTLLRAVGEPDDHEGLAAQGQGFDLLLSHVSAGISTMAAVSDQETGLGALQLAYRSKSVVSLAALEIILRWREGWELTVCALCSCPFFPRKRSDEVYCRRAAPDEPLGGRTCQQVGPQRRYSDAIDPLTAVYRKRGKVMDQRRRRGALSSDAVDRWREAARTAVERARRGRWAPERLERELRSLEQSTMED